MIRIAVLCPSEIAYRRFLPAIKQAEGFVYVGVGACTAEEFVGNNPEVLLAERGKAERFVAEHGGKIFEGYTAVVTSDEVDAVYIPLPPALHKSWALKALEHGKHVLVEKPSTLCEKDTLELVERARADRLALHENYMFAFHDQLRAIEEIVTSGEIGSVRLYTVRFGFPKRSEGDFRYNKSLGGGALIDAGGYTIRYAGMLLGKTAKVTAATLSGEESGVDLYGSGTLENEKGEVVQVSFGMDNEYQCRLEVWGSLGTLTTERVLTAPAGFVPKVTIRKGGVNEERDLPADDAFLKSILHFASCIGDTVVREENYLTIVRQAKLVDEFRALAEKRS